MKPKIELSIEEKWKMVRRHYEGCYKDPITNAYVKFKRKPNDILVNYLFVQMVKLWDYEIALQEKKNK